MVRVKVWVRVKVFERLEILIVVRVKLELGMLCVTF